MRPVASAIFIPGKYIIFRWEKGPRGELRRLHLTPAFSRSPEEPKAYKADFQAMKALAGTMKERYPDPIIERCDVGPEGK
jgi:hypothetical protein